MKTNSILRKDILRKNFKEPPFSILDSKQGGYLKKRMSWKNIVNDKADARLNAKTFNMASSDMTGNGDINTIPDVSILDPYLCEIMLHWFNVENGKTFDCFAGDSSFGFVSSSLGFEFSGIELRKEQVEFNQNNLHMNNLKGKYICDDGRNVLNHIVPNSQDLFFSCPPYYDLEVYSDNENDASNQYTYEGFLDIIKTAIHNSMKCLKNDRFAIIVIGDIRDKDGFYRSMEYDFVNIMKEVGVKLYNHIILADPLASAPMRARGNMKYRKLVKVHQNVLVFFKGDPKTINLNYPNLVDETLEYEIESTLLNNIKKQEKKNTMTKLF